MKRLREALKDLFIAYGEHLAEGWSLVEFEVSWEGREIVLTMQGQREGRLVTTSSPAPMVRSVKGHLSAWKQLVGRYWAASQKDEFFQALHTVLPTLMDRPGSGGAFWEPFSEVLEDRRVKQAVKTFAKACKDHGDVVGARMCSLSQGITSRHRRGKASSKVSGALEAKGSLSTVGGIKLLAPLMRAVDPQDRIEALLELQDILMMSSPKNCLTANKLMMEHVAPLWTDPEPLVREQAIAVAERWAPTLMTRKAFEEALPVLDVLIDYGVALPDNLRHRYLCHLVLGNDQEAQADWSSIEIIYEGVEEVHLLGFEHGSIQSYRGLALTIAAEAQLQFANGEDPAKERRVTKKRLKALQEPGWYRSRARSILEEALHIVGDPPPDSSDGFGAGYRGRTYGVLAMVQEQEGDLEAALENYRRANEMVVAGGIPWHRDMFRAKAVGLAEKLEGSAKQSEERPPWPAEFDPDWLIESSTPTRVAEQALRAWEGPWENFPLDAESASQTPLASILLEKFGPLSLPWHLVEKMKLAGYCDYDSYEQTNAAVLNRFRTVIDEWHESRRKRAWEETFRYHRLPQLFGWSWDGYKDCSHPDWERDFKRWVSSIADAPDGNVETVLRELPDHVYERMHGWHASAGLAMDSEHFLVSVLWDGTKDVVTVQRVFRLYRPLFGPVWTRTPAPKKDFLGAAEPLKQDGTESLATALYRFTKDHAKIRDPDHEIFEEKWLWPWAFLWHPNMEAHLLEALQGEWDHKKIKRAKRGRRLDCFAWLLEQVEAPTLEKTYQTLRQKHDKWKRKKSKR